MSEKQNNEIKKPEELDIDLENNQRALNRDIEKFKPVGSYYADEDQQNPIHEIKKEGFDYERKYRKGENEEAIHELKAAHKDEDIDQSSGTKLNPKLEQITEPDPDEKKQMHRLSSFNKKNKNQPL